MLTPITLWILLMFLGNITCHKAHEPVGHTWHSNNRKHQCQQGWGKALAASKNTLTFQWVIISSKHGLKVSPEVTKRKKQSYTNCRIWIENSECMSYEAWWKLTNTMRKFCSVAGSLDLFPRFLHCQKGKCTSCVLDTMLVVMYRVCVLIILPNVSSNFHYDWAVCLKLHSDKWLHNFCGWINMWITVLILYRFHYCRDLSEIVIC